MKVLVACEYSGKVRRAFAKRGHSVVSCDLLPADDNTGDWPECYGEGEMLHYVGDVRDWLKPGHGFDLLIGFPPCTHLSASGARWWPEKRADGRQQAAVEFFMMLANADVPRIALENPVGFMSTAWRKPDQYIQPWQFGHGECKRTGLWLKGLPKLVPTQVVEGREQRIWRLPPTADRWKLRSETFDGVAEAMADQWGTL